MNSLSYAASVNNETDSDNSSEHNSSNKNSHLPDKTAYTDHYYSTLDFVEPIDFIKPALQPPRKAPLKNRPDANTHSNDVPNNSLYNLGKEFLATNEDKRFMQDSLLVFSDTKQLLKETDLMLHNLTESISLSLNLDTLIQQSQPAMQQSMPPQLNDNKFSEYPYPQQGENYQLPGQANDKSQVHEEPSSGNLMEKLLNFQNLLYLIGIIMVYVIIRVIISLMLLPPK